MLLWLSKPLVETKIKNSFICEGQNKTCNILHMTTNRYLYNDIKHIFLTLVCLVFMINLKYKIIDVYDYFSLILVLLKSYKQKLSLY